jgi:hypothetical protein
MIDDVSSGQPPARLAGVLFTAFQLQAGLWIRDPNDLQSPIPPGVMLYRSVPEPRAIALIARGAAALSCQSTGGKARTPIS